MIPSHFQPFWSGLLLFLAQRVGVVGANPQTWEPVSAVVPAGGFVVDRSNRLESLSFYNAAWFSSEGAAARMGWTGVYTPFCNRGTTTAAYQEDIRRRINYYRAMAGLPAAITFDAEPIVNDPTPGSVQLAASTTKRSCAQAAAYMNALSPVYFDSFALTHTPVSGAAACWSNAARNGCLQSNLAIGYSGPAAIDIYMLDENLADELSNNLNVGHRRGILFSRARDMASGDVPAGTLTDVSGTYPILPANALYVVSTFLPAASAPRQFTSWPPAGFLPAPLRPLRWSLSYPEATFSSSAAAITLTGPGGSNIPVTVLSHNKTGLGDNSLVFLPSSLPATGPADATYHVTVTGIGGSGVPASHTWQTTFFDPSLTGVTQTITGPAQPPASGADYPFTPVPYAGLYEVQAATAAPAATWLENGDGPAPDVTPEKTGAYPLLQTSGSLDGLNFTPRSPAKSFHLTFPPDSEEVDFLPHAQSFSLNPEFIPAANSTLTFQEQFRWLFTVNRLSVEISADSGSSWSEVYGRNGSFTYFPGATYISSGWDPGWIARSIPLAPWVGKPIRLRFILRPGAVSFDKADIHHGCYIDDIAVTNVRRLTPAPGPARTFSSPAFRFDSTLTGGPLTAGTPWFLRVRPQIGTRFMGYSAPLTVTPLPPTPFESAYPAIAAQPQGDADNDGIPNFVEYAFALNPTTPNPTSGLPQPVRNSNSLSLSFTVPAGISGITYSAECSTNLTVWTPVPNTGTGSQRTFTVPVTSGQKCLMRLRVTQN